MLVLSPRVRTLTTESPDVRLEDFSRGFLVPLTAGGKGRGNGSLQLGERGFHFAAGALVTLLVSPCDDSDSGQGRCT